MLDPTGVGHRFDPLADRHTEDDLYRMAQDLLHVDGEGDGQAFTERAASMLCAVFVAAKREGVPCLPYARELIRLGLRGAGARLDQVDPLLCRQLLADSFQDADWESRFLTGSWQTLVSRAMPLLTERVVRTFGGSDFRPADLLGAEPIAVYLRLTERDMRGLKPLLRLVWESLLNEHGGPLRRRRRRGLSPGAVDARRGGAVRGAVAAGVRGDGARPRHLSVGGRPVAQSARRRVRPGRRAGVARLARIAGVLSARPSWPPPSGSRSASARSRPTRARIRPRPSASGARRAGPNGRCRCSAPRRSCRCRKRACSPSTAISRRRGYGARTGSSTRR